MGGGGGAERTSSDYRKMLPPTFWLVQVREPNLKVHEDGTASNFTIYSTVPIYCHDDTPDRDCVLGVSLLAFGAGKLSACLQTRPLRQR